MNKKNIIITILLGIILFQFYVMYYYREQLGNSSAIFIEELVPQENNVAIQSVQEQKSSSSGSTQQPEIEKLDDQLIQDFVKSVNSMKKYFKEHNGKEFQKTAQEGKNILQKIKEQNKNHKMTKSQSSQFNASVKEVHQMRVALDKAKAARLAKENKSVSTPPSSSSSSEKNK